MILRLTVILSVLVGFSLGESSVRAQGYVQKMAEGDQAYSREDYGKAANLYRQALQQSTNSGGYKNDPLAVSIVHKLGLALYRSGNFSEAESTFERERTLLEQAEQREKTRLSPIKPAAATKAYCLAHLADARFANQHYSSAREDYKKVLEIMHTTPMDYGLNALSEHAKKQIEVCEQKLHH